MKRLLLLVFLATTVVGMAQAMQPPDLINYQGVLRDAADKPLDGTFPMVFHFFDAETGGNEILVDSHASVVVSGGLFNVQLGDGAV